MAIKVLLGSFVRGGDPNYYFIIRHREMEKFTF
jgi:hypothetical protein